MALPSQVIPYEGLVKETLNMIVAERNRDRSFDLVDELVCKFGETELAERLYDAIPCERPWQDIAELFSILIWSTSDNGTALNRTMERWLQSASDVRQVQIAMETDLYPFRDRKTMEHVLASVTERFPEVANRCRDLIESRRQLPE